MRARLCLLVLLIAGCGPALPTTTPMPSRFEPTKPDLPAVLPRKNPPGWELSADVPDLHTRPIITGEWLSRTPIEYRLRNGTDQAVMAPPLEKCLQHPGALEPYIPDSNGHNLCRMNLEFSSEPKERVEIRPGQTVRHQGCIAAVYTLHSAGKYNLTVHLEAAGLSLESKPIEFEVIDVPEKAVISSQEVANPALEHLAAEDRERTVIEQIRLGGKVQLYFRKLRPAKRKGVARASWLATLDAPCSLTVSGRVGVDQSIFVAYPHSLNGLTVLSLDSRDGEVERTEIRENPPPLKPQPAIPE